MGGNRYWKKSVRKAIKPRINIEGYGKTLLYGLAIHSGRV